MNTFYHKEEDPFPFISFIYPLVHLFYLMAYDSISSFSTLFLTYSRFGLGNFFKLAPISFQLVSIILMELPPPSDPQFLLVL